MVVEQDGLQQQVTRALAEADAMGDFLIAALLSQCLALIDDRNAQAYPAIAAARRPDGQLTGALRR